jgi:hypothetical protein
MVLSHLSYAHVLLYLCNVDARLPWLRSMSAAHRLRSLETSEAAGC